MKSLGLRVGSIYNWCEERLEIQSIADDILAKFVPSHVNIFYCFGGIMLTAFIFQGGLLCIAATSSIFYVMQAIDIHWALVRFCINNLLSTDSC